MPGQNTKILTPPYWILYFAAFIIMANFAFYYVAHKTFTGFAVDKAYEKGRNYNEIIASALEQEQLQYRHTVKFDHNQITFCLYPQAGSEIHSINHEPGLLMLRRSVTDRYDLSLPLVQHTTGCYIGHIPQETLPGNWEAVARIPLQQFTYHVYWRLNNLGEGRWTIITERKK